MKHFAINVKSNVFARITHIERQQEYRVELFNLDSDNTVEIKERLVKSFDEAVSLVENWADVTDENREECWVDLDCENNEK